MFITHLIFKSKKGLTGGTQVVPVPLVSLLIANDSQKE